MGNLKLQLPDYTKGEEIMNMVTHIVGASFGVIALILCLFKTIPAGDGLKIAMSSLYAITIIWLYTTSAVYHGLRPGGGKRVMRVLDHCTIYYLIVGTYTPILLCGMRLVSPISAWIVFGIEWALAALGTVFTAIDMKKYGKLSMACYIGMGWCVLMALPDAIKALTVPGFLFVLFGGIVYTLGAVLYGLGKKHRYIHSVFHLFVVAATVLQFLGIFLYIL